MQDEVNTKVIALVIKGGRISAEVLEKALKKFVEEIEKIYDAGAKLWIISDGHVFSDCSEYTVTSISKWY